MGTVFIPLKASLVQTLTLFIEGTQVNSRSFCGAIFSIWLIFFPITSYSDEGATIILVDIKNGKVNYQVNSEDTKKEKLYEVLLKTLNKYGNKTEILVLFGEYSRFSELIFLRGLLPAIGFSNIKYFYLGKDKHKMEEIEFSKPTIKSPY